MEAIKRRATLWCDKSFDVRTLVSLCVGGDWGEGTRINYTRERRGTLENPSNFPIGRIVEDPISSIPFP